MLENEIFLLAILTIFASIPAGIWIYIFFIKGGKGKKTLFAIFALGCFTAPALLGLQYLWDIFPQFNLASFVENSIHSQNIMFLFTFILFGAMEEIIKMFVVIYVDKRTLLINKINDAILFSIASALGFSFIENIYYLYEFWPSISIGDLTTMYIFRSFFTTCAHLIFSGIFGYYYGVSKFSIDISREQKLIGEESKITTLISKTFGISSSNAYQQQMIVKGLMISIGMHAIYNYLLQYNYMPPVLIFVILGYFFLQYLLKRKAGHLILNNDISARQNSTIGRKDEDVVIELLGMWFKDKRYVDVIHVCERLLERDPDNNVVKLFKARAMDEANENDPYKKILRKILKDKDELSAEQKNIIARYTEEKAELKQIKDQIKKIMEKEGKTFVDPDKIKNQKIGDYLKFTAVQKNDESAESNFFNVDIQR